jgi:hypothetical protein
VLPDHAQLRIVQSGDRQGGVIRQRWGEEAMGGS